MTYHPQFISSMNITDRMI